MGKYKKAYNKAFNLGCLYDSNEQEEGRNLLEELVERATLKKVIRMKTQLGNLYITYCECDYELHPTLKMPFCPYCGQALDWSD